MIKLEKEDIEFVKKHIEDAGKLKCTQCQGQNKKKVLILGIKSI